MFTWRPEVYTRCLPWSFTNLYFLEVSVLFMWAGACWRGRKKTSDSPIVPGSCELPDTSAGNRTPANCKNSKYSQLMSHLSKFKLHRVFTFGRMVSHWIWNLPIKRECLASELRESICLRFSNVGIIGTYNHIHIFMGMLQSELGPSASEVFELSKSCLILNETQSLRLRRWLSGQVLAIEARGSKFGSPTLIKK